jgi:phosphatidylserine/phosphatidylglycerophosphate/cardiolipin synthase-like enzyme
LKSIVRKVLIAVLIGVILNSVRHSISLFGFHELFHTHGLHEATVSASSSESPTEEQYAPNENLEPVDESLLHHASDHVDIAMYAFTDRRLAEELVELARRGTKIRIYRDNDQFREEARRSSNVAQILAGNTNISIRVKGDRELMHLKAWCDGSLLREGSANWSVSGEKYQDNTLFVLRDQQSINAFERKFNQMWSRTDNQIVQ